MHPKTVAKTFLPLSVACVDAVPDRNRGAMPLRSGAPSGYRHAMNKLNTRGGTQTIARKIFFWEKCRNETGRDIEGSADGLPIDRRVWAMGDTAGFLRASPSGFFRVRHGQPGNAARLSRKVRQAQPCRHAVPKSGLRGWRDKNRIPEIDRPQLQAVDQHASVICPGVAWPRSALRSPTRNAATRSILGHSTHWHKRHQFTPTALHARATVALSAEFAPYRSFAAWIDARRAFG